MELSRTYPRPPELLYPMMLIAAIAVIVFSILGIASIAGWMPRAMVGSGTAMATDTRSAEVPASESVEASRAGPAFQCAECGVIESVREIERRGSLWAMPVAATSEGTAVETTGL
jgi:outer membrane lipoprotein SlyB